MAEAGAGGAQVRLRFAMILAGVLALCGLMFAMPSTAFAAETVDEPIVIDANTPAEGASGPGWEWNWAGSAGTLTLDGADIQIPATYAGVADAAIVLPAGSTIHLVGENSIVTNVASASPDSVNAAIACQGDLAITGDVSSSASIRAEGALDWGIYCEGSLSISVVELNISALTVSGDRGSFGAYLAGDLSIGAGATVAVAASEYGIYVEGQTTIADARQIKLDTENAVAGGLAAFLQRDASIANVEEMIVTGSGIEAMGKVSIAGSNVSVAVDAGDSALFVRQGLEITDGSFVSASSPGHVIDVNSLLVVRDSSVRAEGVGAWSTAVRVAGDVTIDNSTLTALGDDADNTKGLSILPAPGSDCAGVLSLSGTPFVTVEGTDVAVQFVSYAHDTTGGHVLLDSTIGAVEGGALTYAERTFTGSGDFTMSVWAYAPGAISIGDDFGVAGASQRVVIEAVDDLLYVTDNGSPATGIGSITAIDANGAEYPAVEWLDGVHVGYYRFPQSLPAGTYTLAFESPYETAGAAQITVAGTGPELFTLEFCSVEVVQADHVWTWLVQPSTGERVSVLEHILVGASVEIGAQPDEGYAFAGYRVTGSVPLWAGGDASKASQTIGVTGSASITPAVKAASPAPDPDQGGKDSDDGKKPGGDSTTTGGKAPNLPSTGDSLGVVAAPVVAAVLVAALIAVIAAVRMRRSR